MTSKVYFIREVTSANLQKIYSALGRDLKGRVGIKISTGEPGGHHFLNPQLIQPLVSDLNGTIVECCTAYGGKRQDPADHWQAIADHGFKAIAPCDIMDETSEFSIPVNAGLHLKTNILGAHFDNYDSFLILSHFKGHAMGGFGGALKNISIGFASSNGKVNIHSAGQINPLPTPGATQDSATTKAENTKSLWENLPPQDAFLESMADAVKSVLEYKGPENFAYINVANNLSVDCDCDADPEAPEMADLGIFASLDPVALDQACYDAVKNSPDPGKAALIERMDSRHGIHTIETAAAHALGTRAYDLIEL